MLQTKAKPFLKWAGGKTQLLPVIDSYLPSTFSKQKSITYIEPFVGGGAMLFFLLQKYENISRAVINDINPHLINTYLVIRDKAQSLINFLEDLQDSYRALPDEDARKDFYLSIRWRFNTEVLSGIEEAAFLIFLNRTCFNGLYRENLKGGFNVPFGKYENPTICDNSLILADSELLQKVEIINGDFSQTEKYIRDYTFFYFDPPYRPLSATSRFNSYVKKSFDDQEQIRLQKFFSSLSSQGCLGLLSNSDGKPENGEDGFFDELYRDFIIERVLAKRSINVNPSQRGALTELLIRNYPDYQGQMLRLI